jgi:hypothetical protein
VRVVTNPKRDRDEGRGLDPTPHRFLPFTGSRWSLTEPDRRPECERRPSNNSATKLSQHSVNDCVHLEACDFVLYQQLATFQFHDLEIIDGGMGAGFVEFRFQGPMPSFQFRKMRFDGHVGGFS